MQNSRLKPVVWLYYGFQFFFSLLLWLPIFYEYQHRIGLSDAEIFAIQSFYYTAFCFMEIPTGLVADLWGCRRCLRLGAATLVIANLLPITSPNYYGFLVHFFLIALSRSFISGASSAYLYEYLQSESQTSEYKQIEGNARAYGLIGKVVCWSAVGALMEWHLTLPYWLTTVSAALSLGFAWKLPDIQNPIAQPKKSGSSLGLKPLRSLFFDLVHSPFLILVMLQGVAIFVLSRICQVNLFQPILGAKSFSVTSYGAIMSLMTIFEAIGSARPAWVRRFFSDLNAVFVLTLIIAGTLAVMASMGQVFTVVALCLFSLATGFAFPIQRQLLNDAIVNSANRATLLSVESIIDRAACAVVAPVVGLYLGRGQISNFLIFSGIVTLGVVALLYIVLKFRPLTQAKEIS